jgi:uncharacterized membrane protein YraQ (UPF0718 family)
MENLLEGLGYLTAILLVLVFISGYIMLVIDIRKIRKILENKKKRKNHSDE